MCDECRTAPERIPDYVADDVLPTVAVTDSVNAAILVKALESFGESYITTGEGLLTDERTTGTAAMTIMHNMLTVTDRVCAMIEAIEHDANFLTGTRED